MPSSRPTLALLGIEGMRTRTVRFVVQNTLPNIEGIL